MRGEKLGKILILSFEDEEDEILKSIVSWVSAGRRDFEEFRVKCEVLSFPNLMIDISCRKVLRNGQEIELTYTEFEILQLMAQNKGRVFSKEQIYDAVWKEPYSGDYNIVTSHIRHIREKIEDEPAKPIYIQTVWGVGYRFNKNLSSGL